MRQSASSTRLPAYFLLLALLWLAAAPAVRAQRSGDFGMSYVQQRSKFVGSSVDDFFYLRGASIDLGYDIWKGLGIAGNGTGMAVSNLDGGGLDIHQVSMMVGPRYTFNLGHITPTTWNRKGGVFVEGKVGYTFATSGIYPTNGSSVGHASALTYEGGGGLNLHIYHRFDLRLVEAQYVRTQLPNGGTNVQNSIRVGSGINFHIGN